MKKLFTLLSLLLLIVTNVISQTKKIVLLEHFTQASCPPCATYNPRIKDIVNANEDKIVAIKYQTYFPGRDPMHSHNPTEMNARQEFYGVDGVPNSVLDGNYFNDHPQGWTLDMVISRVQSYVPKFDIQIQNYLNSTKDTLFATVKYTALSNFTQNNLNAFLVIIERQITFAQPPGTNGEREFEHVMKKMMPSSDGTPIKSSWTTGEDTTITVSWPLKNVYNPDMLGVVGFVQNMTSKEVLQAGYAHANFDVYLDEKFSSFKGLLAEQDTTELNIKLSAKISQEETFVVKLKPSQTVGVESKLKIETMESSDSLIVNLLPDSSKIINLKVILPLNSKDIKSTGVLEVYNLNSLSKYIVSMDYTVVSKVSTMIISADNSSTPKFTGPLKNIDKPYLIVSSKEFSSFNPTSVTKSNVDYIIYYTGSIVTDVFPNNCDLAINNYINSNGKIFLDIPMLGYDAYYGLQSEAAINMWENLLGQPQSLETTTGALNKGGKEVFAVENEKYLGGLYSTPVTLANSSSAYSSVLVSNDTLVTMLTYEDDPEAIAMVRLKDTTDGKKVVFSNLRLDILSSTSFRNAMYKGIYDFFDSKEVANLITNESFNTLSMYPNPANEFTQINFKAALVNASEVTVYNSLGQQVLQTIAPAGSSSMKLDVASLSNGLYTIKVLENGSQLSTAKLTINN